MLHTIRVDARRADVPVSWREFEGGEAFDVDDEDLVGRIGDILAIVPPELDARVLVDGVSHAYRGPRADAGAKIEHPMPRGSGFMSMRYVPPGEFLRGSTEKDRDAWDDERPRRRIQLTRGFYVAEHPTTVGEFRAFVEATGHVTTAEREKATRTWRSPGFPQTDDHPVVCVSWADAQAFCAWAGLRLLTETEWEYTARGTDGRVYPWGNEAPDDTRLIWSGSGTPQSGTAPVGQCPAGASPFGVLDLAGNVWEWCTDWYAPYPKGKSTISDPTGPDSGDCRVLRGASWDFGYAGIARAAVRDWGRPSLRDDNVGFRAARGEIQSFPATMDDGSPLTLTGKNTNHWSVRIGDAIPPDAAFRIAEQFLLTLAYAESGSFALSSGGGVWVREREALRADTRCEGHA